MSVSNILNLYACGIFRDDELVEAYNDICERLVIHGDVVDEEDQEIFNRFINHICEIKFGVNPPPPTDDAAPSTSSSYGPSTSNFVGGAIQPRGGFEHFTLIGEGEKEIKKFNAVGKTLVFKFKDGVDTGINPITWLEQAFTEVLNHILADARPSDRVGLVLRNDNFAEKPVGISFRRRDQLDAKVILATLEKILQSNSSFFASDALRLHVDRVSLPTGTGKSRDRMTGVSYEEFCRRKTGILVIQNDDNLCVARALVAAMAWAVGNVNCDILLQPGSPVMLARAMDLCRAAGVDLTEGGDRSHIHQFQEHLVKYTIVVYNHRLGKTVYYEGPRSSDRVVLNLIMEEGHYNVITNLCSAFSTAYFCEMCRVRTGKKTDHKGCKYICPACHSSPPCNKNLDAILCNACNRDFRGPTCFAKHEKNLCKVFNRCKSCHTSVWVGKAAHKCGYRYCTHCKSEKPVRHLCFMAQNPINKKKLDKNFIFVFYDFECRQDTSIDGVPNMFLHIPTLCVAQQVCKSCISVEDINQDCAICGKREHIFKGNPVDDFLNYVSALRKKCKGEIVALAHNMKGYDGTFILKSLFKNVNGWNPKIITTGTKLMSINCDGNIKFIDSINYMPMPLSKLPKTFNFSGSKGYFPHFFNTLANQNYVGPLPPTHYYGCEEMSTSVRSDFMKWYENQASLNVIFDFQAEIVKYCIEDVNILRKACLEFWSRFTTSNGVDPFRESCTIAGSCNAVFRRNYLKPNSIGLIPPNGYRMADQQSAIAIKWLLWLEKSLDIQIQHAGNSREVRLREGILVDGFCAATNTVYQFHGCYFHGCEICFPDQTAELSGDKADTMGIRREKTEATSTRIRSLGYNLVEMKECDFKNFLKINVQASKFTADHAIFRNIPLHPRDSFFGGRTNAVKLHYKAGEDEQIRYLDVCSLYPYVNKYGKYPLGHPKIHVGDEACRQLSLDSVEGIVKCTVLPHSNLYHPVLPCKMHGKLMFILCRTCGESLFKGDCRHSEDERKFTGTWVADELREALSQGYKVLEILEIWEYEIAQYSRGSRSGGLFSTYVDNFLKLKQECSGWPSWCTDDHAKDRYISEYLAREGIALDKNNVDVNSGMRYIAKLCLNSFWGKFAQRENLMQSSIIQEPYDLFKMLTDPSVEAHSLTPVNDDTVVLNWDRPDEGIIPLKTVNVALAAYTTANARLELYKYLKQLDRRVLYFDTDSIIFTEKPGEWTPATGDFLGDMTDEIECYGPGSKIVEFVSGGPKNYAFKVWSTNSNTFDHVCKVKGITLNYKNSQVVNFESLKDMVLNNAEDTYVQTDRRIVRNAKFDVLSKPEKKVFRVQYTKRRRIQDGFDTLPYGYRS